MTHRDKLNFMFDDLPRRGIKRGTFAPPIYRLLWRIGVPLIPPHFAGYISNALFMGVTFGVFYCALIWFVWSERHGESFARTAFGSLCAGALLGITLAGYYRWQSRKHSLPPWNEYPDKPPTAI